MSPEELAKRVGVHVRTLNRWVARGWLDAPERSYGKGAGRGGPATYPASALRTARDIRDAEDLVAELRRDPVGTIRKCRRP